MLFFDKVIKNCDNTSNKDSKSALTDNLGKQLEGDDRDGFWFWGSGCVLVSRWIQLIPCLHPCHHRISQLDEVSINLPKLLSDLLRELNVAFLNCCGRLWKCDRLEEVNNILLPVDALMLLSKVHKWGSGLAIPDIGQASLDAKSHVIANHLKTHLGHFQNQFPV